MGSEDRNGNGRHDSAAASDQMTDVGEFTYSPDIYTGTMRVKSQGREMTMKYAGKRLGDCTK
jgi:hypothetical protein